ncbi:MAG: hypothetical protein RL032_1171, partial [Pseudomonadota bacterium]
AIPNMDWNARRNVYLALSIRSNLLEDLSPFSNLTLRIKSALHQSFLRQSEN